MNEPETSYTAITNALAEVLTKKNKAYGDSFSISVQKYGYISALTRISDKFNRLESLVLNDTKGSSLEDTLLDLAGYSILTLVELQKEDTE